MRSFTADEAPVSSALLDPEPSPQDEDQDIGDVPTGVDEDELDHDELDTDRVTSPD